MWFGTSCMPLPLALCLLPVGAREHGRGPEHSTSFSSSLPSLFALHDPC